jgi:hypothetical protein
MVPLPLDKGDSIAKATSSGAFIEIQVAARTLNC